MSNQQGPDKSNDAQLPIDKASDKAPEKAPEHAAQEAAKSVGELNEKVRKEKAHQEDPNRTKPGDASRILGRPLIKGVHGEDLVKGMAPSNKAEAEKAAKDGKDTSTGSSAGQGSEAAGTETHVRQKDRAADSKDASVIELSELSRPGDKSPERPGKGGKSGPRAGDDKPSQETGPIGRPEIYGKGEVIIKGRAPGDSMKAADLVEQLKLGDKSQNVGEEGSHNKAADLISKADTAGHAQLSHDIKQLLKEAEGHSGERPTSGEHGADSVDPSRLKDGDRDFINNEPDVWKNKGVSHDDGRFITDPDGKVHFQPGVKDFTDPSTKFNAEGPVDPKILKDGDRDFINKEPVAREPLKYGDRDFVNHDDATSNLTKAPMRDDGSDVYYVKPGKDTDPTKPGSVVDFEVPHRPRADDLDITSNDYMVMHDLPIPKDPASELPGKNDPLGKGTLDIDIDRPNRPRTADYDITSNDYRAMHDLPIPKEPASELPGKNDPLGKGALDIDIDRPNRPRDEGLDITSNDYRVMHDLPIPKEPGGDIPDKHDKHTLEVEGYKIESSFDPELLKSMPPEARRGGTSALDLYKPDHTPSGSPTSVSDVHHSKEPVDPNTNREAIGSRDYEHMRETPLSDQIRTSGSDQDKAAVRTVTDGMTNFMKSIPSLSGVEVGRDPKTGEPRITVNTGESTSIPVPGGAGNLEIGNKFGFNIGWDKDGPKLTNIEGLNINAQGPFGLAVKIPVTEAGASIENGQFGIKVKGSTPLGEKDVFIPLAEAPTLPSERSAANMAETAASRSGVTDRQAPAKDELELVNALMSGASTGERTGVRDHAPTRRTDEGEPNAPEIGRAAAAREAAEAHPPEAAETVAKGGAEAVAKETAETAAKGTAEAVVTAGSAESRTPGDGQPVEAPDKTKASEQKTSEKAIASTEQEGTEKQKAPADRVQMPDGSERTFERSPDGKVTRIAESGSGLVWTSQDGQTFTQKDTGETIKGQLKIEPDGTYKITSEKGVELARNKDGTTTISDQTGQMKVNLDGSRVLTDTKGNVTATIDVAGQQRSIKRGENGEITKFTEPDKTQWVRLEKNQWKNAQTGDILNAELNVDKNGDFNFK